MQLSSKNKDIGKCHDLLRETRFLTENIRRRDVLIKDASIFCEN